MIRLLASGIHFEINAAPHSFKSFRQITPSHLHHIPARHEKALEIGRFSMCIQPEGYRSKIMDLPKTFKNFLDLPEDVKRLSSNSLPLASFFRNPAFGCGSLTA